MLPIATMAIALTLPGCFIAPIVDSYKRTSTHEIKAEYTKLEDKTFAVIVSSGRGIESENPGVTDAILLRITQRLVLPEVGASGAIPPADVIQTLYNRPAWQSMNYEDIAKHLLDGVERLVVIEMDEFRLTEPGNKYEWSGVAAGRVMVVEIDGIDPNAVVYEKFVSVRFPDKQGYTPDILKSKDVASVLLARFVDRASWLFYNHQEPYYPEY